MEVIIQLKIKTIIPKYRETGGRGRQVFQSGYDVGMAGAICVFTVMSKE